MTDKAVSFEDEDEAPTQIGESEEGSYDDPSFSLDGNILDGFGTGREAQPTEFDSADGPVEAPEAGNEAEAAGESPHQTLGQEPAAPTSSNAGNGTSGLEAAREQVKAMLAHTGEDAGLPFASEMLQALALLSVADPPEWARVRQQLKQAKVPLRDLNRELKPYQAALRQAESGPADGVPLWQQWLEVVDAEAGRLLFTDRAECYLQLETGEVMHLDSDAAARYFQHRADREAYYRSAAWRRAAEAVRSWAEQHGERVSVHHLAKVDWDQRIAWIGCEDGRTLYRVTPDRIDRLPNGIEGVLVIGGCAPDLDDLGATGELARWLEHDTWVSPVGKLTLAIYSTQLMLGAGAFSSRPILAAVGEKGSGKTTVLQLLGQAIYGKPVIAQTIKPQEQQNEARIVNELLAIFDNLDNPPNPSVVEDFIATASTQQERAIRKMRVEGQIVTKPITAFVAITSFSVPACIRRSDIMDRSLIVRCQRPRSQKVVEMTERQPDRQALYRDLLVLLQRVLGSWHATPAGSDLRSAAYMRFARALLGEDAALLEQSLLSYQAGTAGMDDPMLGWLDERPPSRPKTAKELYSHWSDLFGSDKPKSPTALGQLLAKKQGQLGHWLIQGERDERKNVTVWRFDRAKSASLLSDETALALLRGLVADCSTEDGDDSASGVDENSLLDEQFSI